jgi:hypothetical protein
MKKNIASNPVNISFFCLLRIVLKTDNVLYLFEQLILSEQQRVEDIAKEDERRGSLVVAYTRQMFHEVKRDRLGEKRNSLCFTSSYNFCFHD